MKETNGNKQANKFEKFVVSIELILWKNIWLLREFKSKF